MDLEALRGGVAVITGSASGLGLACAQEAASHGLHICLTDVRPEALEEAAATLGAEHEGIRVVGLPCDVTSRESMGELLAAVETAFDGAPIAYLSAPFPPPAAPPRPPPGPP